MAKKQKGFVRTTIDLPNALNEKLLLEADKENRSRHLQMIYSIEKYFEIQENGNGNRQKKEIKK